MVERTNRFTVDPSKTRLASGGSSQFTETTCNLASSSLAREVSLLKQGWIIEEGPWYRLPGTGFNVKLQIDQLERDIQQGKKNGQSSAEVLEENFQRIEQDIQGFKTEYLCEGLLFPIVLDKEIIDGRQRIVAAMYGKKQPLSDFISPLERKGAVKKSIEDIEQFLATAPPGSIAVMTSPDGPSGFAGITYQDTQTYIFRVMEDGRPMGFGVRTDMLLVQNRHLLTALGKDIQMHENPQDEIVEIVANPIFIKCDQGQKGWTFEDVVDIIKFIKKSDFAYKNRSFDEIYQQLQNPQDLWTLDETTERLTNNLKAFFLDKLAKGDYSRQELEIALGITILKLARAIRGGKEQINSAGTERRHIKSTKTSDFTPYQNILTEVQGLPGCNGGGLMQESSVSIFMGTISPRFTNGSLTAEKTLNCRCPFCNKQVDAVITGDRK